MPKKPELPTVETFPAGEFICEKCGKNSYFSLVNVEKVLKKPDLDELYKKIFGRKSPKDSKGLFLVHPPEVKCFFCEQRYKSFQKEMEDGQRQDSNDFFNE